MDLTAFVSNFFLFKNGEEDAGRIGLAIIVMGMVGAVTFGVILDKTKKFK